MIWAGTDIWSRTWTRPGTGREALGPGLGLAGGPGWRPWPEAQAHGPYFFFSHEKKKSRAFFIFGGGSATPSENFARNADLGSDPLRIKKCPAFLFSEGGSRPPSENKKKTVFLFRGEKKVWAGPGPPGQSLAWSQGLPARPWPGPSPSTSHPWRPRQRPTWLKR